MHTSLSTWVFLPIGRSCRPALRPAVRSAHRQENWMVAFFLTTTFILAQAYAAGEKDGVRVAGGAIVLENTSCRCEIGLDGRNRAFVNLAENKDYCQPGEPFMVIGRQSKADPKSQPKTWPSSKVELIGDGITVSFGDSGVAAKAKLAVRRRYFTLTIDGVSGTGIDWLQFCNLKLNITGNVGPLVNAAWNDRFAACVLACNDRTDSFGSGEAHPRLAAKCYREFGFEGAKVAIIGVPTNPPEPANKLLDAIEQVELEQGLPHPMIHGVWIKRAPKRFASYLMASGVGEHNIDQVIEFAKGGFGCIEIYPWSSTPSYRLNPKLFPNGLAGLKKCADKIHAAGLQLGLHTMQSMVGER